MARLARVIVPDYPHHITPRGDRRQQTFFSAEDYQAYLDKLVDEWSNFLRKGVDSMIVVKMRKHPAGPLAINAL